MCRALHKIVLEATRTANHVIERTAHHFEIVLLVKVLSEVFRREAVLSTGIPFAIFLILVRLLITLLFHGRLLVRHLHAPEGLELVG